MDKTNKRVRPIRKVERKSLTHLPNDDSRAACSSGAQYKPELKISGATARTARRVNSAFLHRTGYHADVRSRLLASIRQANNNNKQKHHRNVLPRILAAIIFTGWKVEHARQRRGKSQAILLGRTRWRFLIRLLFLFLSGAADVCPAGLVMA